MGLKVAVVTPYHRESIEFLSACHDSVVRQTYPCLHVVVADGEPHRDIDAWNLDHVVLPRSHGDFGSTPRLTGAYHAIGLGYDAVAFLDADNWYREDHVESLVRLFSETSAGFLSSNRMLCRLDGSEMSPCSQTHPDRFVDTSCMMVTRRGFPVLAKWVLMPPYAQVVSDRAMLHYFKEAGIVRAHSPLPTVFYRCGKEGIYHFLGEAVPEGVAPPPDYAKGLRLWIEDGLPPLA